MSGALAHDQSAIDNRPPNVAVQFLDRVKASPSSEAYRYPEADGSWSSLTWAQAGDRVRQLASGLLALGVEVAKEPSRRNRRGELAVDAEVARSVE